MAGAGFKDFTAGDILTAAQVDEYLMQQTVMRFADAAARTTALSGVLAEGMLSYLIDTNAVEVYDGSNWVSVGSTGDITGITTGATSGLTGGVTSGTADLKLNTTAKGGLLVGTGLGTVTELTVGANNTVLTADSSTASGLKWATPSAGGFTLLATATLSGTGSFEFTSISQSYKHLFINVIDLHGSANDAEYKMSFSNNTGTAHSCAVLGYNGTTTTYNSERGEPAFGGSGTFQCPIQRMYTTAGTFGDISAKSEIWIYDYSSTSLQKTVLW